MGVSVGVVGGGVAVVDDGDGDAGSADPEQDRDDAAARIAARHDELGERARKGSDQDPPEEPIVRQQVHETSLPSLARSSPYRFRVAKPQQKM